MISLNNKSQEERERKKQAKEAAKDEDIVFYVSLGQYMLVIKCHIMMDVINKQETSIEGKKVPLACFNPAYMSNPPPITVGQKYRLSFKTVNADAKLVR